MPGRLVPRRPGLNGTSGRYLRWRSLQEDRGAAMGRRGSDAAGTARRGVSWATRSTCGRCGDTATAFHRLAAACTRPPLAAQGAAMPRGGRHTAASSFVRPRTQVCVRAQDNPAQCACREPYCICTHTGRSPFLKQAVRDVQYIPTNLFVLSVLITSLHVPDCAARAR